GLESAPPYSRAEQGDKTAAPEPERAIQRLAGIVDAGRIAHAVALKKLLRFSAAHVYESDLNAALLNALALPRNVGNRLAAKAAALVPQEHQHQRRQAGHFKNRHPVLRAGS